MTDLCGVDFAWRGRLGRLGTLNPSFRRVGFDNRELMIVNKGLDARDILRGSSAIRPELFPSQVLAFARRTRTQLFQLQGLSRCAGTQEYYDFNRLIWVGGAHGACAGERRPDTAAERNAIFWRGHIAFLSRGGKDPRLRRHRPEIYCLPELPKAGIKMEIQP